MTKAKLFVQSEIRLSAASFLMAVLVNRKDHILASRNQI